MCVIVDTNTFTDVCSPNSQNANEFRPIVDWIMRIDCGKVIYGGTKYGRELQRHATFTKFLASLERSGKVICLDRAEVDAHESRIEALINDKNFDDPHLAAIVSSSGCKIICTNEKRALPFLRDRTIYPNGISPPKFYTGVRSAGILVDRNISSRCRSKASAQKKTASRRR